MVFSAPIQFPIFAPSEPPNQLTHRPATLVRFSRWNNANAEKFNQERRTQKEIEDQLRFEKRFDSALKIAHSYNPAPPTPTFKSTGSPSSPSRPSIQGKKSKYSKNPQSSHPAFKPIVRKRRIPITDINQDETEEQPVANVKLDEEGLSYEFPDAPFLYQYSYTETPKAKPVGIREPLVAPFEPATMGRPWTGRKPLPPSKKKLPEFDSFKLPPPHKKGVKPVQAPGPYLPGSGPKYVRSREEILGEPLTAEEVKALIESTKKSTRQLNIGRDGLTHNMLDNIHAHWKRRRVCKIKCKGVCTVDMDNVCKQLEEKTGGKIIFSRGGVVYLFRGRNYNYRHRPHFPLMLWKPVSPVYPRLIKRVPEGLTLEEATEMRRKGRDLTPICKLGKNGVYCDLVKNVREAFEACELARINCQGLNGSDYRKIGAKLMDLVPCVLISFEHEHILMWRGRYWKSSLSELNTDADSVGELKTDAEVNIENSEAESLTGPALSSSISNISASAENQNTSTSILDREDVELEGSREYTEEGIYCHDLSVSSESPELPTASQDVYNCEKPPSNAGPIAEREHMMDISERDLDELEVAKDFDDLNSHLDIKNMPPEGKPDNDKHSELPPLVLENVCEDKLSTSDLPISLSPSMEGVILLRKQAVESGSAYVLDNSSLDADSVYERAVALAQSAPPGPVFRHRPRRSVNKESREQPTGDLEVKETVRSSGKEVRAPRDKGSKKSSKNQNTKDIREDYMNVVPRGSLGVDELAKLLS